jgi:outer membrane protein TolC
MKYLISILLAFSLFGKGFSQPFETLQQIGINNNPEIQSARLKFESVLALGAEKLDLPQPVLGAGVFLSPVETRVGPQRASIGLSQKFPWFGTLKLKQEILATQAELAYQEVIQNEAEILWQLSRSYWPLAMLEQLIELEEENIEILLDYKELALTKYQNGAESLVNVLRIDLIIEKNKTDLATLRTKQPTYRTTINNLLNREDTLTIQPVWIDSVFVPEIKEGTFITENIPERLRIELDKKLAKQRLESKKKDYAPNFGLGLDYILIGNRPAGEAMLPEDNGKDAILPRVNFSIPIYRNGLKSKTKETTLLIESLDLKALAIENRVLSDLSRLKNQIKEQLLTVELFKKQIQTAEQIKSLLLLEYSNSGSQFEDVLEVQEQLLDYKMKQVKAVLAIRLAVAELNFLLYSEDFI